MNIVARFSVVACVLACPAAIVFCQAPAGADELARAKSIYLSQAPGSAQRQAARFFVILPATGQRVSALHPFYSGDLLKFQFELKRAAFVYVLNSTVPYRDVESSSAARKGIVPVWPGNERPLVAVAPWHVLLPLDTAAPLRINAGLSTNAATFQMDEEAGYELVTVIVSPYPLDITGVVGVEAESGDSRESALAHAKAGSLAAWRANCALSLAPDSGAALSGNSEPESYALARTSERPFAFQVALQHLERNK